MGSLISTCELCEEPILPGEPVGGMLVNGKRVHHECGFRLGGGRNHHLRLCSCFGGKEPPDPPGMTKREAAKAALAAWRYMNRPVEQ